MAYVYTPIATDNFTRPNEQPLNPANWADPTGSPLAVVSNKCVPGSPSFIGIEYWSADSFPDDQYVAATVDALDGVTGEIDLYVRTSADAATSGYYAALFWDGANYTLTLYSLASGPLGTPYAVPSVSPGDVVRIAAVGTTILVDYNGVNVISVTDSSATSGLIWLGVSGAIQADAAVSLFVAGSVTTPIPPSHYSVPDCRNYGNFPNSSRTVDGTITYDVQTSSNPAVPGTDSRTAGAPVDCRVAPNIPQNSRTPGTFGPGE